MAELPDFPTVTAPIGHWAHIRPDAVALSDGTRALSFADLDTAVQRKAALVDGPSYGWVLDGSPLDGLIGFCAIAATGRAGVIADSDWPDVQRGSIRAALSQSPFAGGTARPESPFYIGFTSGSTGVPKGFMRSHRSWTESFSAAVSAFGPGARDPVLAPGRLSHSLFLFAALLGLRTGAGVHVQDRFSPVRCLDLLASGAARCLVAVPSQLLALADIADRRGQAAIPHTRLVLASGACWMRRETPRIRALFPEARFIEFYGASETSFIAWTDSDPALPDSCVGRPFEGVELSIRDDLIFVRSKMLFAGYVTGDDGSLLRDGDWISVRDMGFLDAEGRLHLLGRQRRMIVTAARNIFPEEIEAVLERHPAVAAASVAAAPDRLRGHVLVAFLQPRAPVDVAALVAHCQTALPGWKVPRRFVFRDDWPHTASGKTDHAALQATCPA